MLQLAGLDWLVFIGALMWATIGQQVEGAPGPSQVLAGRIAPNGHQLAFFAGDSLVVYDFDTGLRVPLVGGLAIESRFARNQLAWSPDGRRLLFRRGAPPTADILVADVTSGTVTVLIPDSLRHRLRTFGNVFTSGPAWSPDGGRVAFLASPPDARGPVTAIWLAEPAARTLRMVVAGADEMTAVSWSARGLGWAVRSRTGDATVSVGVPDPEVVQPFASVRLGTGRVTDLLWGPGDSLVLAVMQSGAPHLIAVDGALRELPATLPDLAYAGWLNATELVGIRSPTAMTAELVAVRIPDGRVRLLREGGGSLSDVSIARDVPSIAFALETGSQPRTYAYATLEGGEIRSEIGPALPPADRSISDPWSTRVLHWTGDLLPRRAPAPPPD